VVGTRGHLAQLFYVNRAASGHAFVATIDLEHTVYRSESGRYDSVLAPPVLRLVFHGPVLQSRILARGKRSCAHLEPVSGSMLGDAAALHTIERIFDRARRGARCAAAVGGPIDVAAIDGSGRRWLQRKEQPRYEGNPQQEMVSSL
jgi:hypothetical protein